MMKGHTENIVISIAVGEKGIDLVSITLPHKEKEAGVQALRWENHIEPALDHPGIIEKTQAQKRRGHLELIRLGITMKIDCLL